MNRFTRAVGVALVTLILCPWAEAQSEGRREVLRAPDGFPIHITYFPFKESKENPGATPLTAPVVVLLHGGGENRLLWEKNSSPREQDPFPILLQKRGYIVVTVDLRKHGDSVIPEGNMEVGPNDYPAMLAGDMAAVQDFLFSEHQSQRLNMQKLGIIAIGPSAAVATAYAAFNWSLPPFDDAPIPANRTPRGQDVKAIILISPDTAAGRLKTGTSLRTLKGLTPFIALQVVVGAKDQAAKRQAESIFNSYVTSSKSSKEPSRSEFLTPDTKESGMALFRQPTVYAFALKFLETNLKPLDIPWRDRRSQLER